MNELTIVVPKSATRRRSTRTAFLVLPITTAICASIPTKVLTNECRALIRKCKVNRNNLLTFLLLKSKREIKIDYLRFTC
uniref:Secreted protein n=1 Tax=Meloidogyne incognita TaxID=6306 RepID=A0A914KHY7_MELIC